MNRWKEVSTVSPAELLISSDHIFRNAQRYENSLCCVFPHSTVLPPFGAIHFKHFWWWPMHFYKLYSQVPVKRHFCGGWGFGDGDDSSKVPIMLSLSVSMFPSPRSDRADPGPWHTVWETRLIVSSQSLWLQSIWNLNLESDKVTR